MGLVDDSTMKLGGALVADGALIVGARYERRSPSG
jgi:hypothetical protein